MALAFYTFWGIILISICVLFSSYHNIPKAKYNLESQIISFWIIILASLWMALTPIDDPSATDKEGYYNMFRFGQKDYRDIGLVYLIQVIRYVTLESFVFFFIAALLYVGLYFGFLTRYFKGNSWIVLIASFLFINYFLYGVNTIRGGIALSFCLYGIARGRKLWVRIACLIFSILMHKSTILIILIYLATIKVKNFKPFLCFWFVMLILQLSGVFELGIFKSILINFDDTSYYTQYLGDNTRGYKVGLRWDFIIYSAIPIIVAFFYKIKKKFSDQNYAQILNIYLGVNAVWMMFVRMPSTDRIAYLSWIFFPFLILYPLLSDHRIKIKNFTYFTIIMLLLGGFINLVIYNLK